MAPKTECPEREDCGGKGSGGAAGPEAERFLAAEHADDATGGVLIRRKTAGGGGGDEVTDFDDILLHLGEFGAYQKWLFVMMIPFALFFAFVYFVQIFITVAPQQHWCRVPLLANLTLDQRRSVSIPREGDGFSRCTQYVADWGRVLAAAEASGNWSADPAWPAERCTHGWEFLHTDIPYATLSTELEWVCERNSYPAIAQAVFFCGSIVGGVLFGWIADRFGRIPALVGCNLVGCAGGVATVFSTNLWDFCFYRFLVGLAYDNCFMMMYIIVLEYVGARYRTRIANMSIAIFFGLGCVALPWLALWLADWRRLLLCTSLPMLVACAAPWLLPESARWLLLKGRVDEAVVIIHSLERINKSEVPEKVLQDFKESSLRSRCSAASEESALALWRRAPLRRMMLYLVVVYMACAIVFDALVRLSDALGLDFFLTFTLTSATEMPSVTLLTVLLDRWGRRWLACGPMLISAAACLLAAFVPSGVPSTALAIAARFCINMSYNAAIQWAAELLPTGARASGSGLVHIMGYVATALSPFIVYLKHLVPSLPLLVLALVAFCGGATSLLLPETMGRDLPQTFEDGEELMRARRLFGTRKPKDMELKKRKDIQASEQSRPLDPRALDAAGAP